MNLLEVKIHNSVDIVKQKAPFLPPYAPSSFPPSPSFSPKWSFRSLWQCGRVLLLAVLCHFEVRCAKIYNIFFQSANSNEDIY